MKNSRDLIRGEVVYMLIIYRIQDSRIYSFITIFSFDHRTIESRESEAENYYSRKFSLQMDSSFCDRLRLNF